MDKKNSTKLIFKIRRRASLFFALLILSSVFTSSYVSAGSVKNFTDIYNQTAGSENFIEPKDQALSLSYYTTLESCFAWSMYSDDKTANGSNANQAPNLWFKANDSAAYIYGIETTCGQVAALAIDFWGWTGENKYKDFLESMNCTFDQVNGRYACESNVATRRESFKRSVLNKAYGGFSNTTISSLPFSDAAKYAFYYKALNDLCNPTYIDAVDNLSSTDKVRVDGRYFNGDGTTTNFYDSIYNVTDSKDVVSYGINYQTNLTKGLPNPGNNMDNTSFTDSISLSEFTIDSFDQEYGNIYKSIGTGFFNGSRLFLSIEDFEYNSVGFFGSRTVHAKNNIFGKVDGKDGIVENILDDRYYKDQLGSLPVVMNCADIAGQLKNKAYAEDYSNFYKKFSIVPTTDDSGTIKKPGSDSTSCAIPGIGWIICPIVNSLSKIVDSSWGILQQFLEVKTDIVSQSSSTYKVWEAIRNIANIVFVIIFLVIIFSQVTGFGVSNYGIKKLLPRLIVVAILVNVSFFICQIAVDTSNILGYSIKNFLDGFSKNLSAGASIFSGQDTATGKGTIGIASAILAGTATAGVAWAALGTLIPVLLGAFVGLIMILLLLVGRQALIILLTALSPLAFVAFLLPNTNKLFDKWKKMFTSLLLLFPIVALVVGASGLASKILSSAFDTSNTVDGYIGKIAAAAVAVLPLFIVPGMLKKSLDSIGGIGGAISKLGSKASGSLGKWGTNRYNNSALARGRETKKLAKAQFKTRRYADRMQKNNIIGSAYRASAVGMAGLGITNMQRARRDAVLSSARAQVEAADAKELSEQNQVLNKEIAAVRSNSDPTLSKLYKNTDDYLLDRARGLTRYYDAATKSVKIRRNSTITEVQRQAASDALVTLGRADQIRSLRDDETKINGVGETTQEKELREKMVQKSISKSAGSISAKAPDLVKNSKDAAFGNVSAGDIYKFTKATAATHMEYLNDLQKDYDSKKAAVVRLARIGASAAEIQKARDDETAAGLKYTNATSSFVNAIETIAKTPAYRAEYSGETGKIIYDNKLFDSTSTVYNPTLHTDIRRGLAKINPAKNYTPT